MIKVRPVNVDEIAGLKYLVKLCGKEVKTFFDLRRPLEECAEAGDLLLAEVGGEWAGFAYAVPLKREAMISLYEIGTHPEFRRMGVASALMNYLRERHPERGIRLVVSETNIAARATYVAKGFKIVDYGITKKGQPIVRMELTP